MSTARHILSIEDEPDATALLTHAMKRAGMPYTLSTVQDGPGAIAYLRGVGRFQDRKENPFPSLILLDLKLPKFSGLEVLQWIRSQEDLKSIPVVILTSSSEPKDIDEAFRLGANSYLTKPLNQDGFAALIAKFNAYWFEESKMPLPKEREPQS